MDEEITIGIDTTSNVLKSPYIKKQIEDQQKNWFVKELPEIMKRLEEVPSHITTEVGPYYLLFREARDCYKFGLYHATTSMVGITAERFSMELSEKVTFEINKNKISEKELFVKPLSQGRRLFLLEKAGIITSEACKKLREIKKIRNKYIHPKTKEDGREDSLKVLKLFTEVIQKRFSDVYTFKDGKIVKRLDK